MAVDDLTGKQLKIGEIRYMTMENYDPPYGDFEVEVIITKETIMPKYGRGEEYGYFFDVLRVTKNAPERPTIIGVTASKNLRKNPKLGKKMWH